MMARRLVITVSAAGYLSETAYSPRAGDWTVLSRTFTESFPFILVGRIAARPDYRIHIRKAA